MSFAKEVMGTPIISERSSFASSSLPPVSYFSFNKIQIRFLNNPFDGNPGGFGFSARKSRAGVMGAINEELVKTLPTTMGGGRGDRSMEETVKFKVRAVVTVRNKSKEDFKEALVKHLDCLADRIGRNVVLELISTEVDPKTNAARKSKGAVLKDWTKKSKTTAERVHYTADFTVDAAFGTPGAITVTNKHQKEFFLESITVEGFACGSVHFACNSWVQSQRDHPHQRIFFSNQPYLPRDTPAGLRALREKELKNLRGDGKGERKLSDRIYDFDVYNDLGNPDKGTEFHRPTLAGEEIPYPRRCRTGRPPTDTSKILRLDATHVDYNHIG